MAIQKKTTAKGKTFKYTTEKYLLEKAHADDAGFDLHCLRQETNDVSMTADCYTGIRVEIPKGHVGLLFGRSSLSKYHVHLANSVGVIDSGYTGEIIVKLTSMIGKYKIPDLEGKKIAQLVIVPLANFDSLQSEVINENTERGSGGFGSTGA